MGENKQQTAEQVAAPQIKIREIYAGAEDSSYPAAQRKKEGNFMIENIYTIRFCFA